MFPFRLLPSFALFNINFEGIVLTLLSVVAQHQSQSADPINIPIAAQLHAPNLDLLDLAAIGIHSKSLKNRTERMQYLQSTGLTTLLCGTEIRDWVNLEPITNTRDCPLWAELESGNLTTIDQFYDIITLLMNANIKNVDKDGYLPRQARINEIVAEMENQQAANPDPELGPPADYPGHSISAKKASWRHMVKVTFSNVQEEIDANGFVHKYLYRNEGGSKGHRSKPAQYPERALESSYRLIALAHVGTAEGKHLNRDDTFKNLRTTSLTKELVYEFERRCPKCQSKFIKAALAKPKKLQTLANKKRARENGDDEEQSRPATGLRQKPNRKPVPVQEAPWLQQAPPPPPPMPMPMPLPMPMPMPLPPVQDQRRIFYPFLPQQPPLGLVYYHNEIDQAGINQRQAQYQAEPLPEESLLYDGFILDNGFGNDNGFDNGFGNDNGLDFDNAFGNDNGFDFGFGNDNAFNN